MKIAISATGATLDAEIDPRFGRCQYFIIADTETDEFEAMSNSSAAAAGGAGISAAQAIVNKGVGVVLTGNCGPNAHGVLSSAGIKIITGVSGKVKDAIAEYKLGTYSVAQQANVPAMVCINKYDLNDKNTIAIHDYCRENRVDVAAMIPFDNAVTEAMVKGISVVEYSDGRVAREIKYLWQHIDQKLQG